MIIQQIYILNLKGNNLEEIQNNRLYNLERQYTCETGQKKLHFSIDDTMSIFEDLTKNEDKYNSIFDNDLLCLLKVFHDNYGLTVTFYVFYEFGFSLENCTEKFSDEFQEQKNWMKFGFHSYNAESYKDIEVGKLCEEYEQVSMQLKRITGNTEEDLSKTLRLDRFCGTKEQLQALGEHYGIHTFLTADSRERISYYLDEYANNQVWRDDVIIDEDFLFTKTDIRLENYSSTAELQESLESVKGENNLVVFTHEEKLDNMDLDYLKLLCEYAIQNNYRFVTEL